MLTELGCAVVLDPYWTSTHLPSSARDLEAEGQQPRSGCRPGGRTAGTGVAIPARGTSERAVRTVRVLPPPARR
jgi:hypothetical protein